MEDIAKRGRTRGLGLTVCSQRGQEVAKSVLELLETVIVLRMTGPRSIKAVQDWINVNADVDERGREVIASLPSLQTGEAWVWSPGVLRLLKRVHITKFTTFDSHQTPQPGQSRIVPKRRADIDLEKLGAEIAATAVRARENDPASLRARVTAAERAAAEAHAEMSRMARAIADRDRRIADQEARLAALAAAADHGEVLATLSAARDLIEGACALLDQPTGAELPEIDRVPAEIPVAAPEPAPAAVVTSNGAVCDSAITFRSGARRMLESLGRMAPLRLTRAQWGTVSRMKHTSGTFGTYLGELRRAGFLDEDPAGFTLTAAGFDYLGGRPAPMTAQELQQHYLRTFRAGASRMLQVIMDAHPQGLNRGEIGERAGLSVTSGTFGTYLGELRRNGLVVESGGQVVATDVLMYGAAAGG